MRAWDLGGALALGVGQSFVSLQVWGRHLVIADGNGSSRW